MSPKSKFDLNWNESADIAFIESKQILANATLLVHPDLSAQLNIMCDASDLAVWGVLQQCVDNVWQPLSFFSKKLSPAETRYSAFDSELLALYATIRHFRHNLEGVSIGHARPYITAKFRRKVFTNLHGLGHPSHRATKPLINTRFVW